MSDDDDDDVENVFMYLSNCFSNTYRLSHHLIRF